MKKSFTLMELMISITIFSIIVLFLYKAVDITKQTNDFYESHLNHYKDSNKLKEIFIEDFMNIDGAVTLSDDKEKNSILSFKTTNIYHNPFYMNVSYFLTRKNTLIRLESKTVFNSKKVNDTFLDTSYIDVVLKDVKKFRVLKPKDKNSPAYMIFIKFKDNKEVMYTATKF